MYSKCVCVVFQLCLRLSLSLSLSFSPWRWYPACKAWLWCPTEISTAIRSNVLGQWHFNVLVPDGLWPTIRAACYVYMYYSTRYRPFYTALDYITLYSCFCVYAWLHLNIRLVYGIFKTTSKPHYATLHYTTLHPAILRCATLFILL